MNFLFQSYDETLVMRKDGGQGKKGFTTIPQVDKWENLSVAQKVSVIKQTDRIACADVPEMEQSAMRDKMDAFASLYGFKGNAQVGKNGYVYCNRRPDSKVSFDAVLEDSDSDEILAQLGFGSR
jgi:hypothetical protein